ncbi:MAG: PDZ domain-containing protein [Myxococcota bacterium]
MRLALVLALLLPVSCAYPKRSTSLSPVREGGAAFGSAPEHLYRLQIRSAIVPPEQRSGLAWDGDGGPDPYVKVFRDSELIFETRVIEDELAPEWNQEAERNVLLPPNAELRFEIWDDDTGSPDPIGIWRSRGLPASALPDADARIVTDGNAELTFRIASPRAHRGVGIESYEVRGGYLLVRSVAEHSPAGRAGVQGDDRIVRIGARTVDEMGEAAAATALSMASERGQMIAIERDSETVEVRFDQEFVWLTR